MKKKLFWKFNIIDIIIIILVLAVLAFLGMKVYNAKAVGNNAKMGTITFVVEVPALEKGLYDEIAAYIPTQMAASGKWVDGNIVSVTSVPCKVNYLEVTNPVNATLSTYMETPPDVEYVTAYFTCTAAIDLNDLLNMVGTQEVRLGRAHFVKGVDFEISGTVISLEKSE
jgi:hypothetical protein